MLIQCLQKACGSSKMLSAKLTILTDNKRRNLDLKNHLFSGNNL